MDGPVTDEVTGPFGFEAEGTGGGRRTATEVASTTRSHSVLRARGYVAAGGY